jgi:hypothetical protein
MAAAVSSRSRPASKSRSSSSKGRDRPRRPRVEEEETPVFGGRLLIAAGLIAAATIIPMSKLGEFMEPRGPTPTDVASWGEGVVSTVRITLVTADYDLLGCASDKTIAGLHCAFKADGKLWPLDPSRVPDDNKLNIVMPYRTWFDNKLVFVAGLWAQPEAAFRLHSEPPAGQNPDKLARFAVECQIKFVGKFDDIKLRWKPNQAWTAPDGPPWVGTAQSCKIVDEPE